MVTACKSMHKETASRTDVNLERALEFWELYQLLIDKAIMEELRDHQRNLAVSSYDYPKQYDMVRHDWMTRVYLWMGVPQKVVNVISKLMEGSKIKLEVTDDGKLLTSRTINFRKGFLKETAIFW